jgi:hypothetical protein
MKPRSKYLLTPVPFYSTIWLKQQDHNTFYPNIIEELVYKMPAKAGGIMVK